jgi:hypothetical protein
MAFTRSVIVSHPKRWLARALDRPAIAFVVALLSEHARRECNLYRSGQHTVLLRCFRSIRAFQVPEIGQEPVHCQACWPCYAHTEVHSAE